MELESNDGASFFQVLGVRVNALQIPSVIAEMEKWIAQRDGCHFIAVTGMHGITEAQHDPRLKVILNSADLVVPDGTPLVWLGRMQGHALRRRVYGPELMRSFLHATSKKGYRHFFYGGAFGVAELLSATLLNRFPGLQSVGTYSPPFRPLTSEENEQIVETINNTAADVLWVGLSTPKQERWMHEHREKLKVPVVVGVGAAFDFHSGTKKQAPPWMREHGLEWLFRLAQEPRRLWRRYLVGGTQFLFWVALEQLGLRKFP